MTGRKPKQFTTVRIDTKTWANLNKKKKPGERLGDVVSRSVGRRWYVWTRIAPAPTLEPSWQQRSVYYPAWKCSTPFTTSWGTTASTLSLFRRYAFPRRTGSQKYSDGHHRRSIYVHWKKAEVLMSKLKQPNFVRVDKQRRIVITSTKNPKRTVIIGEGKKGMFVLFQNGTEITLDKHGNTTAFVPMLSEVF